MFFAPHCTSSTAVFQTSVTGKSTMSSKKTADDAFKFNKGLSRREPET